MASNSETADIWGTITGTIPGAIQILKIILIIGVGLATDFLAVYLLCYIHLAVSTKRWRHLPALEGGYGAFMIIVSCCLGIFLTAAAGAISGSQHLPFWLAMVRACISTWFIAFSLLILGLLVYFTWQAFRTILRNASPLTKSRDREGYQAVMRSEDVELEEGRTVDDTANQNKDKAREQ